MSVKAIIAQKAEWFFSEDIRPYVYVREENRISAPGTRHVHDWFSHEPIFINPLQLENLDFAEQIYHLETSAFGPSNMAMPRWVFYDCAVMPGFVAGFAMRTAKLPPAIRSVLRADLRNEWTPLSLFIIIPTMHKGEWVAHNLCTVNSLLGRQDQLYSLGFLSKAFGLWYANVETCSGMTQWSSPARKLHSHYGHMEVLATYTPVHSHAETLTYRVKVNTNCWDLFYDRDQDLEFLEKYKPSGLIIDPTSKEGLISMQKKIENGDGPFYLSAAEIADKALDQALTVYISKN